MDTQKPFINREEVLLKENGEWLHFANPYRIIQADTLNAVIPSLREIEDLIQVNGWHAAGFISYEAAPAFDPAHLTHSGTEFPYLWFGLYPSPSITTQPEPASAKQTLPWLLTVDRGTYNVAIEQIKTYIAEGQTYQVNYTMRLQADFKIDAWEFFLHLAQTQNNHAAFLDTGRFVICSASPELFFQLNGETVTCHPMKGTTHRGRTTQEDAEHAQWLKASEKNRAENVMIVDMIRNDLGRIAKTGSVNVPELFTVEKYPTLWQMTSTVTAKTNASLTGVFTALFPCASITGAPKVSTMRIISELETTPRKIYTGSIGHIAPNRKATFNVAIRTALIDRETKTAEYGIGGGIVWDSTSTDEYAEALLKARVLTEPSPRFSLFETMLWTPEEGFFLLRKHVSRLLDSANYFNFPIAREVIEIYLGNISSQFAFAQRIRLLLDRNGNLSDEVKSFQLLEKYAHVKVCLSKEPVNSRNVFLFHKTTHREIYDHALLTARARHQSEQTSPYEDVLLYNEHGELTEFTIGNLVTEINGTLYTPPISCGLLAGTFRAHLLETGQVQERAIVVDELKDCTQIFRVNSVRKWQKVNLT